MYAYEVVDHVVQDRHFNPWLYNTYFSNNLMQVLLWSVTGVPNGYHQYRPFASKSFPNCPKLGRYYTWSPRNNVSFFGADTLHFSPNLVFVTEGMFDACRFHNHGLSAVAVLSNDPRHLTSQLKLFRHTRTVVGVLDNDVAGSKLGKFCDRLLKLPNMYKDVGEMPEEAFTEFLKEQNDER